MNNALLKTVIVPINQRWPAEPRPPEGDAAHLALAIAELAIDVAERGVPAPETMYRLRRQVRRLREAMR